MPVPQESPQAQVAIPAPPAPPAAPQISAPITFRRPITGREVQAMRQRGSELSRQLISAQGRRETLVKELDGTDAAARPGIIARLDLLDRRILQIETDIAENGRQLALAPIAQAQQREGFGPFGGDAGRVASSGGMIVFMVVMAVAFARWLRSGRRRRIERRDDSRTEDRLTSIEQAVDAIAIEVERIGESQRYQGRLLSEGAGLPDFGAREQRPERVPVERGRD
jgi:hypothetical protein